MRGQEVPDLSGFGHRLHDRMHVLLDVRGSLAEVASGAGVLQAGLGPHLRDRDRHRAYMSSAEPAEASRVGRSGVQKACVVCKLDMPDGRNSRHLDCCPILLGPEPLVQDAQ